MTPPAGMPRDEERLRRVREALAAASLDAVVCTRPSNVLLVTGYWPVIGSAVAIATREGAVAVAAPEDEDALASEGWADAVRLFAAGSLERLAGRFPEARAAVVALARDAGAASVRTVGHDGGAGFEPTAYVATFGYGERVCDLVAAAFPGAAVRDATETFARLRASLTPRELEEVRRACAIAAEAFDVTVARVAPGIREVDLAGVLTGELLAQSAGTRRCAGEAFCMSGPNGARAASSFQRSSGRALERGDFVLLHVNSCRGGFWTDVTRTFTVGPPDARQAAIAAAIDEAGEAACEAVRPGVRAAEVDRVARAVMARHGLDHGFVHGTGHGVGFVAIDHEARPRLHPRSDDVLETGMVFNVEPGYYEPGRLGIRHCDMIAVTPGGAERLTPFRSHAGERLPA